MIKKLIGYLMLAICMMVMLSACQRISESTGKTVYDDNSQIVQDGDNMDIEEYAFGEEDSGHRLTLSGFSGVKSIYKLTANKDGTVEFYYDLKTSSGKFKCVYINTNGDVEIIVEQNSSQNSSKTVTLNVAEGESTIKIVGLESGLEIITDVQNSDGNVEFEYFN